MSLMITPFQAARHLWHVVQCWKAENQLLSGLRIPIQERTTTTTSSTLTTSGTTVTLSSTRTSTWKLGAQVDDPRSSPCGATRCE